MMTGTNTLDEAHSLGVDSRVARSRLPLKEKEEEEEVQLSDDDENTYLSTYQ